MKTLTFAVSGIRSACVKIALCLIPLMMVYAPSASAMSLSMGNVTNPLIAGGKLTGTGSFGISGGSLGFDLTIADIGGPVQVFLVAYVPAGSLGLAADTWFCLTEKDGWQPLIGSNYVPATTGIAAGLTLHISLLNNVDFNSLPKAEVYVGYGLSTTEMIQTSRYKAVIAIR